MAKSVRLKLAIWLTWFLGLTSYSVLVYAAQQDEAVTGIDAIPFEEIKYAIPVILVGTLCNVLTKMAKVDRPQFRSTAWEISKDIACCFGAGGIMFLAASWIDTSVFNFDIRGRFMAIFFAAYGGAGFIEIMYNEGFLTWGRRKLGNIFGSAAPQPPPSQD